MTRTRATAKQAGTSFERLIADYLAQEVDDRIDRRVKTGAADKGDIAGLRHHGHRLVIECKNVAKTNLAGWVTEAQVEAGNDGALLGLVVHKRRGKGQPGDQYVTLTLSDLVKLLTLGTP
ncbi:hypothetical protein [Arthrobacter sp. efr-133-TYG-118]|uniref:putative PDDEXK endonuclease n=1 Tax=Arthrobacter sp. efr-133-TYG-118 TaxID=3040279 RepID=UPI00254BA101|nr:hypothetical protein [Arthrobacter sp. efr-133-TYG-118]